jgi:hypothetical protein
MGRCRRARRPIMRRRSRRGWRRRMTKSIVHRDLKPENIFLTKEGRVKILDFGLAKLASNARGTKSESDGLTLTSSPTEAGMVMGTAGYMAPEQVRGSAVDSRTDIFAFGAVLYEMISGKRAFRRDTAAETMTAILKEDPPELSELDHPVSPGLERIVRRCLEKQPEQRFQSAKDLAFALEALTGTTSKTAANAAIAGGSGKPRWPLFMAAAAVLGIALGAATAWYLRPAAAPPPTFTRVSFHRGEVIRARFAPDGKTVVYSAKLNGTQPDTYVIRDEYPESVPAGLHGAMVLGISKQAQVAVLVKPVYFAHTQWLGTLATSPLGGSAPRELLENVADADWSPDGNEMAVIDHDHNKWRVQYPIGKVLLEGDNWISDERVSPDGQQIALFRHPPNVDDRGDVVLLDRSGKRARSIIRMGIAGRVGVGAVGERSLVFRRRFGRAVLHTGRHPDRQAADRALRHRADAHPRYFGIRYRVSFDGREPGLRWRWWSTARLKSTI